MSDVPKLTDAQASFLEAPAVYGPRPDYQGPLLRLENAEWRDLVERGFFVGTPLPDGCVIDGPEADRAQYIVTHTYWVTDLGRAALSKHREAANG